MENTSKHRGFGKIIWAGVVLVLLPAFLLLINSPQKKMRSELRIAELEQITMDDVNETRTEYINQNSVITIVVDKEYNENGKGADLANLDADSFPIMIKKGYSLENRTYQANDQIETEMYLEDGAKSCAFAEGQYGKRIENSQISYLNADGSNRFIVKSFLYNHSWAVITAATLLIIISAVLPRRWNVLLFTLYIVVILYFTLMFRDANYSERSIHIFWYYKRILTDSEVRSDIFKNIWLFIPLGAILYRLCPYKRILLVPVMLSVLIEVTQYVTGTGFCELDDVVSNGMGGIVGYAMGRGIEQMKQRAKISFFDN